MDKNDVAESDGQKQTMLSQVLEEKSRKQKLESMLKSYEDSFTIHGLSRIFTGNTIERITWSIALLCSFSCIVYFAYSLGVKYRQKDVYIDVQRKLVRENFFPSITFCINRDVEEKYCNLLFKGVQYSRNVCRWQGTYPIGILKLMASTARSKMWDEHLQIGCHALRDTCNVNDVSFKLVKWQNYSRANCLTWNYEGTFSKNKIEFEIGLGSATSSKKYIEMILHHHNQYPFLKTSGTIRISPGHDYQILLSKTKVKRLPAPMKSKCVNMTQNFILPGRYTIGNCQESVKCMKALKICGDTFDHCKGYLTAEVLAKYQNESRDIMKVWTCLKNNQKSFNADSEDCPPPCEEVSYDAETSLYKKRDGENSVSILMLEYKNKNTYLYSEEKEVYSFSEFLGGMGGFIGMVAGMSLLSIIEIFIFSVLRIAYKYA